MKDGNFPSNNIVMAKGVHILANWFEDNPIKSVIVHTIFVAGATWAIFLFIYDENKANLHRAEVENLEAQIGQYKAKVEVLESRVSYLASDNSKLNEWLINTPKTIPYLEGKIEVLEKANSEISRVKSHDKSETGSGIEPQKLYYSGAKIEQGGAFFDPETTASIGINRFNSNYTADVQITLPGKGSDFIREAKPGTQWRFDHNGKSYLLILHETNWLSNTGKASVQELKGP